MNEELRTWMVQVQEAHSKALEQRLEEIAGLRQENMNLKNDNARLKVEQQT